jgi:hypothetical protein
MADRFAGRPTMPNWREKALSIFLRWKFRPWALLTPILVLLVALPLLRPLRAPTGASQPEQLLLDTASAISRTGGMRLDPAVWRDKEGTVLVETSIFADRPPVFAVLLAGPAWVMQQAGLSFEDDEQLIAYLLTLLGTTIPVAVGGGVIYRMGRLFELSRPRRALLAILVTFGGGWISYATVLNPHAPAASALVCSAACLLYLAAAKKSGSVLAITFLAGLLAALAAALSPWTLPFVLPLPLVLMAMSIPPRQKVVGLTLLTLGAMPIVWVHAAWSLDAFGSVFAPGSVQTLNDVVAAGPDESPVDRAASLAGKLFNVTLGNHGLFTHFPLIVISVVGLMIVLRKHWPPHAKMLGAITFVGSITVIMLVAARQQSVGGWMFGVQWFVVFLPLTAFWLGAVLRRDLSRRTAWTVGVTCALSVVVGIAGAGWPLPADPFKSHTAAGALGRWIGAWMDAPTGEST